MEFKICQKAKLSNVDDSCNAGAQSVQAEIQMRACFKGGNYNYNNK